MQFAPTWFYVLSACILAGVFVVLPASGAAAVRAALVDSDKAKLIAALAAVAAFAVVLFTALQIKLDLDDRETERAIRRDETIDRAWTRLLTRAAGNTGKGGALTTLFREGVSLDGIDLSCRAIGDWEFDSSECRRHAILSDIEMIGDSGSPSLVNNLDFERALLQSVRIQHVDLNGVSFRETAVDRPAIRSAYISGDLGGSVWRNGDFVDGYLDSTTDDEFALWNMHISGTIVPDLEKVLILDAFNRKGAYYWADDPPLRRDMSFDKEAPFPFYGLDQMNRLIACRPPAGADGKIIPVDERDPAAIINCEEMSPMGAMYRYPEAYAGF